MIPSISISPYKGNKRSHERQVAGVPYYHRHETVRVYFICGYHVQGLTGDQGAVFAAIYNGQAALVCGDRYDGHGAVYTDNPSWLSRFSPDESEFILRRRDKIVEKLRHKARLKDGARLMRMLKKP